MDIICFVKSRIYKTNDTRLFVHMLRTLISTAAFT